MKATVEVGVRIRNIEERVHQALNRVGKAIQVRSHLQAKLVALAGKLLF